MRLAGIVASPGLATGPAVLLDIAPSAAAEAWVSGTPEEEAKALTDAIAAAQADLATLLEAMDEDGAEILDFQVEMLGDPSLSEDALAAIGAGTDALTAWRDAMAPQIAVFAEEEDDYFRAREADMVDMRDRVVRHLLGIAEFTGELPAGSIVVAHDLTPSTFLRHDWARLGGVALAEGSAAAHVAMLARARDLAMVVGLGEGLFGLKSGDTILLDAEEGACVIAPGGADLTAFQDRMAARETAEATARERMSEPAVTADGHAVAVMINVDDPAEVPADALDHADGIGLFRTEFLFIGKPSLPDEDTQYHCYVDLLRRLGGRPLVVRTVDIGGDKPLPSLKIPPETNPFLGLRGLRLCLAEPDLFRPQVRALLRAAVAGPCKVMLPMVTVPDEVDAARDIFRAERAALSSEGVAAEMPQLGMMVEVPAAALTPERFDVDFYSIGSNDLTQYVMAASRDASGPVARLLDAGDPAVLKLIANVVEAGRTLGRDVSLCGDAGSDTRLVAALLGCGLRTLSVAPGALARVKAAVAEINLAEGGGEAVPS